MELKFSAELKSSLDTSFYGRKTTTVVYEQIDECEFDKRNPEDISPEVHLRVPLNFGYELFVHSNKGAMDANEDGWFETTFHIDYLSHKHFELNVEFDETGKVLDAYIKGWDNYGEFINGRGEDVYIGHDDIQVITD